jgi:hypothetical protein
VPRTTSAPAIDVRTSAPATGARTQFGETGELERLLARYIGPMAKIIAARARKQSPDEPALLQRIAEAIDDEKDRAEFLSAARKLK